MPVRAVQLEMEGERELIRRARAGDEHAFRLLMERHGARAHGVALRITRSHADAEDVTQQAFVRAWHALGQFREEAGFGTWLHRIVARRALDRATEMKTRASREDAIDLTVASIDAPPRDVILLRRLEQLMAGLSAAQRAVVTMHYWEELTVEEIAATLGMPANTVKTHLSRARAALRKAWMKREEPR